MLFPYRRVEDNLIAAAAQACCVFIFTGAILTHLFAEISNVTQDRVATEIMAFSSADAIAALLVVVFFGVLILIIAVVIVLLRKERHVPTVRTVQSHSPPELSLPEGGKWHCFLSHIWSTAQVRHN